MVKAIFVKIISALVTLLIVITFLALLDYLATLALSSAIAGNDQAWQAFFAINLFGSLINIITQSLKMVVSIPFYFAGIVDFGAHLYVLGQSILGLFLSFLFFCLNMLFGLGGFFFSFLKLLLRLLPFTSIPSDATVISVGMMLGWDLANKPDWLWFITRDIYEYFYWLPLLTQDLLSGLGSTIAETLNARVPIASQIFWLDILEFGSVPNWTSTLITATTNITAFDVLARVDFYSAMAEFDTNNHRFLVDLHFER